MEAPPSIVDGDYSFADFQEAIKETEKVFARFEKKFGREPESVEEFYKFLLAEEGQKVKNKKGGGGSFSDQASPKAEGLKSCVECQYYRQNEEERYAGTCTIDNTWTYCTFVCKDFVWRLI